MIESRRAAVAAMLGARSVAVVGASPRPDSFGSRMVVEAQRGSARVHLVNPRYDRIGDMPCAPTLADLDAAVDLVLLGVPDTALLEQLESAVAAKARSAVLFGSAHGLREKIATTAADAGMALCGAGCMGFVNNALGVRALGYLEPDPLPAGGISLVTHSGSAFSTLLRARRGFGFRLAVSSGQELVTDTADYVDYALDDPQTRLIALLMETPRSVPRLRQAVLRAAEHDVPVVILTIGGSPRGRAMVAAHSGALAGEQAAWQAFCAATGAVHVSDLAEFTDTLELFSAGRRARGGAIATVHDSGAERALAADLAHELGVEFADLADDTLTCIGALLDDGLVPTNPLDVWGTGADTRNLFGACLQAMADDPGVGVAALAVDLVTEFDDDTAYADAVLDVAKRTDTPLAVLTSVSSAIDRPTADRLRDNGIPVLEGTRSGIAALGHLGALAAARRSLGPGAGRLLPMARTDRLRVPRHSSAGRLRDPRGRFPVPRSSIEALLAAGRGRRLSGRTENDCVPCTRAMSVASSRSCRRRGAEHGVHGDGAFARISRGRAADGRGRRRVVGRVRSRSTPSGRWW